LDASLRALLIAVALIAPMTVRAAPKTACQHSRNLVGKCFRIRGRLLAYNGTPTFRIWPVGTHRLLGVNGSGPTAADADDQPDLGLLLKDVTPSRGDWFETSVYGDYLVCPFTRSRPGWMQYVCIARASHVIARPR
jgi:hypothetical protein